MPGELLTKPGEINVEMVAQAVGRVAFSSPVCVEKYAAACAWPRLCGKQFCTYPRYFDGAPQGIVARTLIELGYPVAMLKDLDTEYRVGEVLHPGVEIDKSRNQALTRIDAKGMALLAWFHTQAKHQLIFSQLHVKAFRPRRGLRLLDRRDRPWLY